jgi:hypothetical protein
MICKRIVEFEERHSLKLFLLKKKVKEKRRCELELIFIEMAMACSAVQ